MTLGSSTAAPLAGAASIVLVVDDDTDTLTVAETLLADAGYEVMLAESGKGALRIITITRPDLLLLDVGMPEMDGYEVCAKLQESKDLSYLPVVLLASADAPADRARAVALGAVDTLAKPFDKETLLAKVATHVKTNAWWQELKEDVAPKRTTPPASDWELFKESFAKQTGLTAAQQERIAPLTPTELYAAPGLPVPPQKIARQIAEFMKLPYQALLISDRVALGVLPTPFCKTNLVVALTESANERSFVVSDPFNWELVQMLRRVSGEGRPPKLAVTEPTKILALFDEPMDDVARMAGGREPGRSDMTYDLPGERIQVTEEVNEQSAPIIRLVNQLIENAYAMGASDIHIEPGENDVVIRYRVDGILRVAHQFPQPQLIHPLVSRIKIMADLDIVERRLPQDGRIVFKRFASRGGDFDLRVATAPMNHGEKVVMRILDKRKAVLPLTELGFSERHMRVYQERLATPYGMILHVGPTGSGKSMSLYSALNEIRRPDINIQTAEDPIEYTLPGINQMQIHRDIGLTFQRALRSYLRQDPDVILVGEIRDRETADIAVEAALTGHLLLSTLHTNDASSTIVRLLEMGIEPYMVSSSIVVICAQRLLRRLCATCKEAYRPDERERRLVGVAPNAEITLYRPAGCDVCNRIGFKGRISTHEMLVPNDRLRLAITTKGMTAEALKRRAVEECGMTTLYWDAMEKVRAGICHLDDVLSEVRRDEFDARPEWMFEELSLDRPANRDQTPF
ncbi:MAG: Flp pilus assembly complex ATPase component TadA [Deltaproteobacteria bacterium]|nr:Flp pilus assembly complex ATPase component TadA [Deltaproteobacteria bacterium]